MKCPENFCRVKFVFIAVFLLYNLSSFFTEVLAVRQGAFLKSGNFKVKNGIQRNFRNRSFLGRKKIARNVVKGGHLKLRYLRPSERFESYKNNIKLLFARYSFLKGYFRWPIRRDKFWISSYYGIRSRGRLHAGIDLAAARGTPVYASDTGIVEYASHAGSFGNMILIRHDQECKSRYAHLHKIVVPKGKIVRKGELVGYVGSTGNVSGKNGNHLHFEILVNNLPVNPIRVLS